MSHNFHKLGKLSSAVYLITGFFNDSEPMKWRLRTLAMDLSSESLRDKYGLAREIISLFAIAKTAGLVSETNANIIIEELSRFESGEAKRLDIRALLATSAEEKLAVELEPSASPEIKDKIVERGLSYMPKPSFEDSVLSKDRPSPRSEKESKNQPDLKDYGAVSVKKNSRQSVIIGLIKRKKEIMIKDVSPLIGGCSEKTIQREVLGMVASGILRKMGEKRWSRYTLA